MEIKNISELLGEKQFIGEKVKLVSLIDKEFIIRDFDIRDSKYYPNQKYCVISGSNIQGGEDFVTITTSKVVIEKLEKVKNNLPVKVKLIKKKRYYDLV